jgi:hypothetical protein
MKAREMAAPIQAVIAAALLDPERPVPAGLTSYGAGVPAKRFAVYRNNVVVSLVNALAARFPATQRIVGQEFFLVMAREYLVAHPPRTPVLMFYGESFPDFIAQFEPARGLDYLADVARLEAARTRSYHAADMNPLDPAKLHAFSDDEIGQLRFARHPATEIVRSAHPVVTIWAMNSGETTLGPIEDWHGEDALIVRPQLEVQVRALPAGGAKFLAILFAGGTLAAAAEAALAEAGEFDVAANLAGLISSGAAAAVRRRRERKDGA